MDLQKYFQAFHKKIKVETEELRDKRNIIVDKIRGSLKRQGHPIPEEINQGSYIYGVGVVPPEGVEHDIDVGLGFDILSDETSAADVRDWVYAAIKDHTDNVESRGPCIRVHYAAGYHVDLVCYARHRNSADVEDYHLATKDGSWKPANPKKLKKCVLDARKPFEDTKDSSGSDQLQRTTRYFKRWNDLDIPGDSPDKPFGLATLLMVMKYLPQPVHTFEGRPDDLGALIQISTTVVNTYGRISVQKPTQEFEDVFMKLSDSAMDRLKKRFTNLLEDLKKVQTTNDETIIVTTIQKQFGNDFPATLRKAEALLAEPLPNAHEVSAHDMRAAIPNFSNPSKPWCRPE